MRGAGLSICLPEHMLSFKLSGLQRLLDGRVNEARTMIEFQEWFNANSRDIMDESDFTLAVRTQLIYPSGTQTTVDGSPYRWQVVQTLLDMVWGLLWGVQKAYPRGLEIHQRRSIVYPTAYFLHRHAEDLLINKLVGLLVQGHGGILHTRAMPSSVATELREFLTNANIKSSRFSDLRSHFLKKQIEWKNILLIRGMLVHRILILGLKKRWNVQYGLHEKREPIAVPYHAKGIPSSTSEWGHPEVAILLTCLSFYYAGLTQEQLRQSLLHVLQSDDSAAVYERWIHQSPLVPGSLRESNSLNLDDSLQMAELWQHFRFNTISINHFLNNFVFPIHAKQFQHKIQASGWDIPIQRLAPLPRRHTLEAGSTDVKRSRLRTHGLTTGFSGTNDNKSMLPLTIQQNDLPQLLGTNAEVLTYLLEDRNREYVVVTDESGRRLSERQFLELLTKRKIKVLIDAGAQILECDNLSLVTMWMQVDHEAPAAVFFNESDKAMVYHRKGHRTPLLGSPYAENMSDCIIYLDQSHTRGCDLKLPANAVGGLTLGLGQSKDHTVQAAMRLRQLGSTQSLVFFSPIEVHQSIIDFREKDAGGKIDSSDVIAWLLEQTCRGIEQLKPLYYSQGIDFCNRTHAGVTNPAALDDKTQRAGFLGSIKHKESYTLSELYTPKEKKGTVTPKTEFTTPELNSIMGRLRKVREEFEDNGEAVQAVALQEVEQEREVAVEAETVRAIQRPPHRQALVHIPPDQSLRQFCVDGMLNSRAVAVEKAFEYIRRTSLGTKHGIFEDATQTSLCVTRDFIRVIETQPHGRDDNYLRPVHWVLWSTVNEAALMISPYEAELLLPIVRDATNPKTHLLIYAAPVSRKMLKFDGLSYFAIPKMPPNWTAPQWLRRDVGIFAGRLYFPFEDYHDMCEYLGLTPAFDKLPLQTENNSKGAEPVSGKELEIRPVKNGSLTKAPQQFLQQWLTTRRRGQDITQTPMGYVVQNKRLDETHIFFQEE